MDVSDRFVKKAATPNAQPKNIEEALPGKTLPQSVIAVQRQATQYLTEWLEACFSASDQSFSNLAENSKRLADQEGYFYAIQELYLKKKPLAETFFEKLDRKFSKLIKPSDHSSNDDTESSHSLGIAPSELQALADRAPTYHQVLAEELTLRFSIALQKDLDVNQLPISRIGLFELFVETCNIHEMPKRVTTVLYKIFERTVLHELGSLYTHLNARMNELGVVLDSIASTSPAPLAAAKESTPKESAPKEQPTTQSAQKNWAAPIFHQESSRVKVFNNNEESVSLSPVKNAVMSQQEQIIAHTLTILSERHGLANSLIPLLSQLQKPLAYIAQQDQGFFVNRDNPARRLVNALSTSALAFGRFEQSEIESDRLFLEIKRIVEKLRDRTNADAKFVSILADEFEQFIHQERRDLELFEKRLLTVVQGKQQANISQQRVRDLIAEITQDFDLPSDVRDLIDNAWYQVMFVTALKHGIDSAEWDEVSQTLTDLVIGTQPYISHAERARGLATLEELKQRVLSGLESISFDPVETEVIIQHLDKTIHNLLRDENNSLTKIIANAEGTKNSAKKIAANHSSLLDPEMIRRAKSLVQGTWFDLNLNEGREVRCRLAAIIGNHETYLFVNRSGGAVAENSLDEVVEALANQQLQPLRSHKIFDVALRQVIGEIKQELVGA